MNPLASAFHQFWALPRLCALRRVISSAAVVAGSPPSHALRREARPLWGMHLRHLGRECYGLGQIQQQALWASSGTLSSGKPLGRLSERLLDVARWADVDLASTLWVGG